MTTGATPLLSLSLPVEGELDGTWGDVVNYGITNYVDIAVAGTLTLTNDGAVTLDKTAGTAGGTNITSSLTGAGTVTAQFAVVKITGTLTATKVVTVGTAIAPATSKTYIVDNAATGGVVTFKAFGQTGISIAVGEKCTVYFNGTDYVKVASTVADGVTSVSGTGTVNGITLTGTVTSTGNLTLGGTLSGVNLTSQVTGTLPVANGGTGVTTSTGSGSNVLSTSPTLVTPILGTPTSGVATNLTGLPLTTGVTGLLPVANGGTGTATPSIVAGSNISVTGTWPNQTIASTASGSVTSVTGSGNIASSGGTTPNITFTGILPVASGGTATATPGLVAGSNVTVTGTWPNQTIAAVGGGGSTAGVYPAIATGAIANGSKVIINADGTVSVVNGAATSAGTATNFYGSALANTSNVIQTAAVFDSTNNKTVVAYIASSGGGYAVVGTVSGTSISFGTAVLFDSSATSVSLAFDVTDSKIVVSYGLSSAGGKAIIGTVSGTSISFGTAVSFTANSVGSVTGVYDSSNDKIVISYRDVSTTYGTSIVGTVSGTSISFGTAVVFNSAQTFYTYSIYVGSGKVVIAFADGNNSYHGYAIVGTVSGTSISFGTSAVFNSATLDNIRATYDTTNAKVVLAYADIGNSNYATAIVGTVSGTSISFGTKVVFASVYTSWFGITYAPSVNYVIITCYNPATSTNGATIAGFVSGTTITFGPFYQYNSVSTFQPAPSYDSTSQKVVVGYSNTTSSTGAAQVFTIAGNLTATNFIGISDAAYANGATATIQTVGSTDDAQTGLTPGLAYYVQNNGTLSSTAGSPSVFAGTAVAATKILVKG
jgi:hypothetical protein